MRNILQSRRAIALLGTLAFAITTAQVEAVPIHNTTGLASPVTTIDFNASLGDGTVVTNQYAGLGVTFSPNLVYDTIYSGAGIPNIGGGQLRNFAGTVVDPFSLLFAVDQTEVAFAMATNPGTSTFSAYLDGVLVESFSAATDVSSSNNFFGFSGIVFDEIRVDAGGSGSAMLLDNLQMGTAATASVPDAGATASLLGLAMFGLGALRRKLA
jgi:VPDSG-CTERM motif